MKTTIKTRWNELGLTSSASQIEALVATGLAHYDPCHRCGGSGQYGRLGTCYGCGGNGRRAGNRPLWVSGQITHETLDTLEARLPAVAHTLGNGARLSTLARQWGRIGSMVTNPRPFTPAQWVRHEGERVARRLHDAMTAAQYRREARERKAEQERKWQQRDEEQGVVAVPVTDARLALEGVVVSTRQQIARYGYGMEYKGLVLFDMPGTAGQHKFKLWGTLPRAICTAETGQRVAFTCKVQVSDKDPKFGFWSRPTRARFVTAES